MKPLISNLVSKIRRLLWHCLWVIPICLLLLSYPALADFEVGPEDIIFSNSAGDFCPPADLDPYPIPNTADESIIVGDQVNLTINVVDYDDEDNPKEADFDSLTFDTDPNDCSPGASSFTCSNVNIELQEGDANEKRAHVSTSAGAPEGAHPAGLYYFDLAARSLLGTCYRAYSLNINEPPFDIGFVLDRSNSMNQPAYPDDPSSLRRWEALRTAIRESMTLTSFINDLIEIPAPEGSRLGLTIFGDGVLDESFATPQPIDGLLFDLVESAIEPSPTSPTGHYTRMGPGLQDAEGKLNDCSRARLIILFTDGEQNPVGDPNLVADGTSYMNGDPINATCPASNPANNPIEIVSVGILQPSSTYADLLQALASSNGDNAAIFTTTGLDFSFQDGTDVDFSTALTQAIIQALSGSSPQIVAQYQDILDREITLAPFSLNQNVGQLILKLTFEQELDRQDLEELLANVRLFKDGDDVTNYFQPTVVGDTARTIWLRSRFESPPLAPSSLPSLVSEGSYEVRLSPSSNVVNALSFRLVSIADDSSLDMSWSVTPDAPRTSQTFSPTVQLSWLGQPISNANVEALILRPGDDLGDLLAKTPGRVDPCLACLQDAGSAGYQKYLDLLRNDPDFVNRLKPNEPKITFNYQGDGVYSTAYNPGDISGVYQVLYRVIAEDPSFGTIQREAIQSVYVRFGEIDLAASSETTVVDGNKILVYWRPVTIDGRLIGPGQGSAISIDGIDVVDIEDNQDGSYILTLSGDPDTPISVKVLGEEIYQGQADQFGPSEKWPLWLIILTIVLVLLLLILLVWFLRRGESASESASASESESESSSSES